MGCRTPLERPPGTAFCYSDVGFALVRFLVERIAAEPFEQFLAREVLAPLALCETCFVPLPGTRSMCAATERGNRWEEGMVARAGRTFTRWRDRDTVQVGEVNDGNTFYALGGVSSHAGLFAPASDVLRFARMWLRDEEAGALLSRETRTLATTDHTPGMERARGLGWSLNARGPRPYGDVVGPRAFGHSGFTGTSLCIDPDRALAIVLLTNRVHPDASNDSISRIRPRFHDLVAAAITDP